jgi:hypothetical protein
MISRFTIAFPPGLAVLLRRRGGRSSFARKCAALGLGIIALLSGGALLGQPAPTVQLALPGPGTNFVFSTSAQAGNYYTMQSSSNLLNWTSLTPSYAGGTSLSWTNPVPSQPRAQFFRTQVNPTNLAVITNYHGWNNAIYLSNGLVEAFIVPNAGRVMQFRFAGTTNGPFWENPLLYGQTSTSTNWNTTGAFGGDKSWPAPQSNWTGGWPPPTGFDGSPYTYGITNGIVTITSPIDTTYRIQVTRTIQLEFNQPVMVINTVFKRYTSASQTNNVGIWTITQVSDPVGIYVPVPSNSIFAPTNYLQRMSVLPPNWTSTSNLISFTRNLTAECELGFDAGSLAWLGTNWALRIDGPRIAGLNKTNYPNGGCSTSVYTNPNNVPYVELEFFAPMTNLLVLQSASFTTTYTLFNRSSTNPVVDARAILGLPAQ